MGTFGGQFEDFHAGEPVDLSLPFSVRRGRMAQFKLPCSKLGSFKSPLSRTIRVYDRRAEVIDWLGGLLPEFDLPLDSSDEELREYLIDGTALCYTADKLMPGVLEGVWGGYASDHRSNVKKFLSVIAEMGLPGFSVKDLEEGSMSSIVECLLALRDNVSAGLGENMSNYPAKTPARPVAPVSTPGRRSPGEDRRRGLWDAKSPQRSPLLSGQKANEVFQFKRGQYTDLPAAKISEMIQSNSLDNAPTQSLLRVVNGILDESIERKRGEIPHRVVYLLRNVVQEIEHRISIQAEHIRNQNSIIKTREDKYRSKIKALETLVNGTNEENEMAINRLELVKEIQVMSRMFEEYREQMEEKTSQMEEHLTLRAKEAEFLLMQSKKRVEEVETASELQSQLWSKKANTFRSFMDNQKLSIKDIRISSQSIKQEMFALQMKWRDEISNIGLDLKGLVDAAENYHGVLAENQKLFNEVQELKGNIRVYCRVRPFLPGQDGKSTAVDYIGENGEILISNPSKQGKDGYRMFKFNKIFNTHVSQAEVFSDIQPLIRSVLDGFNVCIFAYGQTGSGKTYTMMYMFCVPTTNTSEGTIFITNCLDVKNGSTSRGCLHLIDLAGSERVERSEATGDRLKEAQHINKSLSALGDVIFALAQKNAHVPYRNSKLTQVLQSSLGGQAKTLMFVQINPDVESCSETISTLKFAERVSGVELGAARSNKEGKDIKDLLEQVASLKDTISRKDMEIEQLQVNKVKSPSSLTDKSGSSLLKQSSTASQQNQLISGSIGSGETEYEDNASDDGCSAEGSIKTDQIFPDEEWAASGFQTKTKGTCPKVNDHRYAAASNLAFLSYARPLVPGRRNSIASQVPTAASSIKPPKKRVVQ
ncbi:Kinesin-4 [Triticum urartu]|uniref:Kinesin-4 n=1 Tax=Triticum urartu TaxID=4572 RepID=M8ANA7_TRIUA|nr:Kinesin-4 [Triticum urartu]